MGNAAMCGGPASPEVNRMRIIGHIKNSQTRALMAILDQCKIRYIFNQIDIPKVDKPTNKQGV